MTATGGGPIPVTVLNLSKVIECVFKAFFAINSLENGFGHIARPSGEE
jgi:hypothetical protein